MIASAKIYGDLAQLVEHLLCKQGVRGSTPLVSTKEMVRQKCRAIFCLRRPGTSHSLSPNQDHVKFTFQLGTKNNKIAP